MSKPTKIREEDQDEHAFKHIDNGRGYGVHAYQCKCGSRGSNEPTKKQAEAQYREHLRQHGIIPTGFKR